MKNSNYIKKYIYFDIFAQVTIYLWSLFFLHFLYFYCTGIHQCSITHIDNSVYLSLYQYMIQH